MTASQTATTVVPSDELADLVHLLEPGASRLFLELTEAGPRVDEETLLAARDLARVLSMTTDFAAQRQMPEHSRLVRLWVTWRRESMFGRFFTGADS